MISDNARNKRILLLQPPFYRLYGDAHQFSRYPLALGFLAGAIKGGTTWDVRAYNADFSAQTRTLSVGYLATEGFRRYRQELQNPTGRVWQEIRKTIAEYRPTVVGISTMSQNFESARLVARLVKELDERTVVIAGGPHPSTAGRESLNCPSIDICVRGEGESTIVDLLDAIEHERDLRDVKGICFRRGGEVVETPPRRVIENLDSLAFPHQAAREVLKDYSLYRPDAFQQVLATRGCPYGCLFCSSRNIWSRRVRFRSPANVTKEIRSLQNIGLHKVEFADDTFGVSRHYLHELCGALARDCPGLKWECELHVKLVDDTTVTAMKRAGCVVIRIGIESGNNHILRGIKKNITIEEALDACRIIKRHGIRLDAFFMVGFPDETEDTLTDTITAIKNAKCDRVLYSIFTPYPGTELFEVCKARGTIGEGFNASLYNHQSPLNYFCAGIPPKRFRELAASVEATVDAQNARNIRKEVARAVFSRDLWGKVHDLGLANSIRKGMSMIGGRKAV
jgi:anaerobic magnesium-protoporphyrin IX monomethyl ester cyclase